LKTPVTVLVLFLFFLALPAWGQTTIIKGKVTDAETKEAVPFANISLKGSNIGTVTDLDGKYLLQTDNKQYSEIQISYLGYKTITRTIILGQAQEINVKLVSDATVLQEIEIRPKKEKERYRNKNNPAVDFVREMIEHKKQNQLEQYGAAEYEQYEKLQMSLSNMSDRFKQRKIFKKYKWLFENVDTVTFPGKALLPIYLEEKLTEEYYQREPERRKTVTKASQKVSIDDYIDNDGLSSYLNYLYNDIDIYQNNITLLTNQFLSPIADSAPTFYKFYLTDTLAGDPKVVELTFVPRNPGDFLFQGQLYVSMDSTFAVRRLSMTVNKNINLNWVRELHIDQEFSPSENARFYLSKSRMRADFGLSKSGGGIFGERVVSFKNFVVGNIRPEEFFEPSQTLVTQNQAPADQKSEEFWTSVRHDPLSNAESKVYQNIDSLQNMPSFRRTMDIAVLLLAGYKGFGWWELGPVNTFYSFNPVEGFRLRVGGRTTPRFNERIYLETYAAYGFLDEKWKYFLSANYSFTGRSIREFPLKTLRASFQRDTKIPGQELQFVQEDNFLLSFKRGVNDKWLYNDIWIVDYLHEFDSHFSYKLGLKYWEQVPAGGLSFAIQKQDELVTIPQVNTADVNLELRWAPGEQFYQTKNYRVPIPNKYPIITTRFAVGIKGLFDSQYNYQSATFNIFKRVYLSQFGYSDIVLEGGAIFGQVPFPLLTIHRANQSYSYQLQSYNLMNFLEFVSDRYVAVNFDYYFNGFFFNKIPLLKKLKWREVATFKVLYGGLRDENDPAINTDTFVFPLDAEGNPISYSLEGKPYMEASIGIANIFKLIRVDLVKRLSYLEHPNVSEWGVRARFKFDF
jgi:hypothetical protein